MKERAKVIFFLDDEPTVCKAVHGSLSNISGVEIRIFTDAIECLRELENGVCNLLISDVNMPGLNGIKLLEKVHQLRPQLPVLLVTGYGDVPIAVEAMKLGAFDFIEKPLSEDTFIPVVKRALAKGIDDQLAGRVLTKSEIEVLKCIAEGKSNKQIAYESKRSVRTIENHRHRIKHKLQTDNTVELIKVAINMGLIEL